MKKSFIISMIIALVSIVLALWFFGTTNGDIPINWDANGNVSGYGPPAMIFLFPGICLFITLLMVFIPKIDPKGKNIKESGPLLPIITILVSLLMLGLQIFTILTVNETDIIGMNDFIFLFLGGLFLVIGIFIPNVKQNYMLGIRTPWTLASEEVWTKTHKTSGIWFIFAGILFLAGIVMPVPLNFIIPLVFMGIVIIGIFVYSYALFAEEKKKKEKEKAEKKATKKTTTKTTKKKVTKNNQSKTTVK